MKKNFKTTATIDDLRVDVMNDKEMVSLGIRVAPRVERDPSVWTKSISEKFLLRREKSRNTTTFFSRWSSKKKSIPVRSKLIINLKRVSEGSKLTLSFNCGQSDIPRILSRYSNNINTYSWNGKTYTGTSLPFWGR